MIRRLKISAALFAAGLLLIAPGTGARAQTTGRFHVLIPAFTPVNGADKKFGEKAADDLRTLMNSLLTHQPVDEKAMSQSLKKYKLKMDELDCPKTRQLAAQMDAQVALCATYEPQGDDYVVTAQFWSVGSNESFDVTPITAGPKDDQAAAKGIFDQFDRYTTQLRAAANCQEYASSRQWENALENCNHALELNPASQSTRYLKAHILYDMKSYPEALTQLDSLLALNPIHEDGLQLAGYIAGQSGLEEKALDYYSRFLDLQPGNAQVRMKIAYDLAQAGDPAGAAQLIQTGLDTDPDNLDLLVQFGGFAFAAGQKLAEKVDSSDAGPSPEAAGYFHKAIDAYKKVFAAKGADTNPGQLRTVIAAYVQLGELNEAISMAEQVLQTHPEDDGIWSYYADALQRAGRLDDALTALDRLKEINPDYPNLALRQGKWLIEAGRIPDAVVAFKSVASTDPKQAEIAARLIFSNAYAEGVQKKKYDYAVSALTAALGLPNLTPAMKHQLTFWEAYALYQGAYQEQQSGSLAAAKATLPRFQRALDLLQAPGVGDYARKTAKVDINQMLDNVRTFIDIQEKIIKRGR